MTEQITIEIQKARDGRDYVQLTSLDQTSINIVLIAAHIIVKDLRT